jgi:hypothetical protein
MTAEELIAALRYQCSLDLDAAFRSGWFHRPFTTEELNEHPDSPRIWATIEAVVDHLLVEAKALAGSDDEQ